MPFPEPVSWDRKEIYRERRPVKSESLGSSPVGSRWRDSPSFSYRGNHHGGPREFSRRGSADYRRPPGRGRQQGDWHMFPEESGYGYMPSRSCERMIEDRSYWTSSSRVDGRYRSGNDNYKVRGYQKNWEGPSWQQNNSSSADRPFKGTPVILGGKPCNGVSDMPIDRRHTGMYPGFGVERHFNASPVIYGGRHSNGFPGAVIDKTRNGFSPRNISDRSFSESTAVSGDKPCLGYSNALIEKTRNGFSGASTVKMHNRFAPERLIDLSTSVFEDQKSDGFSRAPVVKAPNGFYPHTAADRPNNLSPAVSRPCRIPFNAVVEKAHDQFAEAHTEKTLDGLSPSSFAERPVKVSPNISTGRPSLGLSGATVGKTPNGPSCSFVDGNMTCDRPSDTSVKDICNGFSHSSAAGSACNVSLTVSGEKPCNGIIGASTGSVCNSIAGPEFMDIDCNLSINEHASDCIPKGSKCKNELPVDSLKHQHDVGTGEVDGSCSIQRHDKELFLRVDCKPLIWTRSGSFSSRGHSSSSRSFPVDSKETVDEYQQIKSSTLCSPSGDAADCITSSTTSEEAATWKKARLGWGQGLAKYEKKIVDDPCLSEKQNDIHSPRVGGEFASPTTPTSATCSSSPDNKFKSVTDEDAPDTLSLGSSVNIESLVGKLDMSFITSEVHLLLNMIHSDVQCPTGSGSESTNAMRKLLSWRTGILKAVEMTDSEMESLENEIQSSKSEYKCRIHCSAASSSMDVNIETKFGKEITACNAIAMPTPLQVDSSKVKDEIDSPRIATAKPVVPPVEVEATLEVVKPCQFAEDASTNSSHMMVEFIPSCSCDVHASEQGSNDAAGPNHDLLDSGLCEFIFAANKEEAGKAGDELSHLLSINGTAAVDCQKSLNGPLIRDEIAKRKKLLRFTERAITLKYRALRQLWKEDSRLLEIRKSRPKSAKRLELGSRASQWAHLKSNSSIRSRFSSPEGSTRLVPSCETFSLTSKLLSDCHVTVYKEELKMPSLILDEKEKQMSSFVSYNALVEDPVAMEKERALVNPWTPDEKETFLDKLALFGKDFRKIASYLDHKTTADCVEFYYKNHKAPIFERTRKKAVRSGTQSKPIANVAYMLTSGDKWNQESAAADVLAGISSSLSSEAISPCVSSSFNHGDVHRQWKRKKVGGKRKRNWTQEVAQNNEETCSGESCGEMDFSALDWTDEEKHMLLQAVMLYGNNFEMVSKYVKTRYSAECKAFYSKVKKRIGSNQTANSINASGKSPQDIDVRLATPLLEPVL
ncbi:unnamed protein product [Rhodiola kirilowii]